MDWRARVSPDDVREAFRLILKRDLGADPYADHLAAIGLTVDQLVEQLVTSEEFAGLHAHRRTVLAQQADAIPVSDYRSPPTFRVTSGPAPRMLLVGYCLLDSWEPVLSGLDRPPSVTRVTANNASRLPPMTAEEAATYDFQICQVPLRALYPDWMLWGLRLGDDEGHARAFAHSLDLMKLNLDASLEYNRQHGLTTFLLNCTIPQQNPSGRMAPRYALSNPVHYVERLNQHLAEMVAPMPNVHLVDFDSIVSAFGRRHFQDDVVIHTSHGAALGPILRGVDVARLEASPSVETLYGTNFGQIITATYLEVEGMYRSIRQVDAIKLVIFDLDDTLWRGVAADSEVSDAMREGWPLGMVEAVAALWRRGIVVAIVSKNDEEVARRTWNTLYEQLFPFDNFAARMINWESKAQNVGAVLEAVNLLPSNALLVDDNPVERATVKAAFPDIRVMDATLPTWRRNLLWAPELQPATFTQEAAERNAMVQRQIEREAERQTVDRSAFLASLDLSLHASVVTGQDDPDFPRCFELLNKTNQFNTTGRRWAPGEMATWMNGGGRILALAVQDRFTAYGIVALALLSGDAIVQVVMSCRVFGMEVEQALVSLALDDLRAASETRACGTIVPTDRNRLSLGLFESCGFQAVDQDLWSCETAGMPMPSHITVRERRPAPAEWGDL